MELSRMLKQESLVLEEKRLGWLMKSQPLGSAEK